MDRIQLVSTLAAAVLLVVVLELVRRRRLLERYALLWLFAALIVIVLALWSGALGRIASLFGIVYPPNALFFIALAFTIVLLLHFSSAVSRLTDQSKVLAQRLALLEERVREVEDPLQGTAVEESLPVLSSLEEPLGGLERTPPN